MKHGFFTVQNKLLSGFIGILVLAGFAGITGYRGINAINYQNSIGTVVDELSESASDAQAASLRYIIYEDDSFHTAALESADKVLDLSKKAEAMMDDEGNRENTKKLVSLMEEYRDMIFAYKELDHQKLEAQSRRQSVGLDMISQMDLLISSMGERLDLTAAEREVLKELQQINVEMNDFRSTALNYIVEKSDAGREDAAAQWLEKLETLYSRLDKAGAQRISSEYKKAIFLIQSQLKEYKRQVGNFHSRTAELWQRQYQQRDVAAQMTEQMRVVRDGVQSAIALETTNAGTAIVVSLIIAVVFSFVIAILLSRNITVPLIQGTEVAKNIAEGKLQTSRLNLKRQDELGSLGSALDTMGHSLQVQDWLQRGKQGLNDELRGDQDLTELAGNFIGFIVKHLEAQMGAFYMYDGKNSLDLTASYGFSDRSGNYSSISLGEGFIGQAAVERETLYFTDLEETPSFNYAAGEKRPPYFMAAVLQFKGELIAAFIIGSFTPFNEEKKDFISENIENAAVILNAAKSRDTIAGLLENSQQQQEELKQTNEELEDQTRALKESEAELQAQQEELRVTNEELEERTQAIEEQRDSIRVKNEELIKAQDDIKRKASDLEQASRYKSEFLANMSHELRTPLNSILILAQLLSKNGSGNLTEKQINSASAIHASGSDLLKLINEILDLSKVESGKIELNIETVPVANIIGDLKRIFTETAREKGLDLSFRVPEDFPEMIRTDSHRLQQVLRNLITNALKFTDEGKVSLKMTLPESSWGGLRRGEFYQIRVEDTGIGIAREKQAAVFEAFQQADGSTMRKYGGTGLGLSISRELIKLLGGELSLESEIGKGSAFIATLPFSVRGSDAAEKTESENLPAPERQAAPASAKEEVSIPAREEAASFGSADETVFSDDMEDIKDDRHDLSEGDKTILIIEDDPQFVNVLADLIREKGFKILIAEDGETGLHFADYYKPSAIILDIGLPGIDGWTVMERLKRSSELRHIPVHFMSGSDETMNALKMGAIGYLTKPVSIDDVNEALAKLEKFTPGHVSNLLVVEDDDIQRESIRELIENEDVEITDVSTGQEAFELLSGSCYDCMILDLGLKDMSGFELLKKIESDTTCSKIPIIIYTGRDLTVQEEETLKKYAESIIIKGVRSPERLLDETSLFLHRVEASLPEEKREILKNVHNGDTALQGKKILIVDDDMRNVFALSNILEDQAMEIVVARDGMEAVEKVKAEPGIDLILMDIMMPRMDGYEAMRMIRKEYQFKKLPIIALTAKAMKGDRSKCIEAGASDYLAKPVETDKLLSMLRVWLYV